MKRILLAVAGREGPHETLSIVPGVTSNDVLAQLGLNGFQIANPRGGFFKLTDDLFPLVEDGQKLFASPADVQAGTIRY